MNPETPIDQMMRDALFEAERAGRKGEIPVGALIVHENRIISRAHNVNRTKNNPTRHAEMIAIEHACRFFANERLNGCSLFVTKEPCAMCAGAIIHARIEKVYIGSRDDKYGACGTVFPVLGNPSFNHVPEIFFGVLEEECTALIKGFFSDLRKQKKEKGAES